MSQIGLLDKAELFPARGSFLRSLKEVCVACCEIRLTELRKAVLWFLFFCILKPFLLQWEITTGISSFCVTKTLVITGDSVKNVKEIQKKVRFDFLEASVSD